MSVINTMLRGLDERGRREAPGAELGAAVRSTVAGPNFTIRRAVIVVAAALGGAALATAVWTDSDRMGALKSMLASQPVKVAATHRDVAATSLAVPPPPAPAAAPAAPPSQPVAERAGDRGTRVLTGSSAPVPSKASPDLAAVRVELLKPISRAIAARLASPPTLPPAASTLDVPEPVATSRVRSSARKTYTPKQLARNLIAEAASLTRQGRFDDAKQPLTQALLADPSDVAARQMLVQLHVDTGHLDEARALLDEGLQQQPAQPGLAWMLARLKAEAGDTAGAITLLEEARIGARDDPQIHALLGALLLRNQRYDDAAKAYLVALRTDPANATWLLGAGAALEASGNTPAALEAYERAQATNGLTSQQVDFVTGRVARLRH